MFIVYLIAFILFAISISIVKSIYTYSEDAYEYVDEYAWKSNNKVKKLKKGANANIPLKLPMWIWLLAIVSFFIPVINLMCSLASLISLLVYLNNTKDLYYKPGKLFTFLTKKI